MNSDSHYGQSSFDIDDRSNAGPQQPSVPAPRMPGINLQQYTPAMDDLPSSSSSAVDPSPLIGDEERNRPEEFHPDANSTGGLKKGAADNNVSDTPQTIEPPTWRHPISSTRTYFRELSASFSWEFLSWLAIDQCCISGGS